MRIDHILMNFQRTNKIKDVRNEREAEVEFDPFLVRAKSRVRIKKQKTGIQQANKTAKWNKEKLKGVGTLTNNKNKIASKMQDTPGTCKDNANTMLYRRLFWKLWKSAIQIVKTYQTHTQTIGLICYRTT